VSAPFHILLVEDEPAIRELVSSMLTEGLVRVACAATGPEGLRLARTQAFHLILMDVVLPQLDGISVCRLLKGDPATARIPVYMLTAKTRREDVEQAMRAGADGYISKPFRGTELLELVARLRTPAP
jgi:two-component system, OmpR family, phosphate regulon response regulator PhoB